MSSLNRYLNLIKIFHTHLYLHVSVGILIQSKNFSTSPILVRDMTLFILSIKLMHFQVGCFFANSSYIYISARKENYKISKRILESIIFLKKNKCSLDDIFLVKKMCDFLVIIHWFDVCIIVLMNKYIIYKKYFFLWKIFVFAEFFFPWYFVHEYFLHFFSWQYCLFNKSNFPIVDNVLLLSVSFCDIVETAAKVIETSSKDNCNKRILLSLWR